MRILLERTKIARAALLLACSLVLSTGSSFADVDLYLCAGETTITMPDGVDVTVWGFAEEPDNIFGASCRGTVTVPGPELRIADTGILTVHLKNTLAVPISIMMPGQVPDAADVTPVWIDASGAVTQSGSPERNPGDVASRVRSFVKEVAPGTADTYSWPNMRNGTFLYQTATHPAVQVQMGLYGALINDATLGSEAYTGVPYDDDQVLLFSEIDYEISQAVATGNYGPGMAISSTIDYDPNYYLVNGMPFTPDRVPFALTATTGETVLLRLLNAGYDNVVPSINGVPYLTLYAEDGFVYPYTRTEYSADLPAGKTVDATFSVPAEGYFSVYDRRLNLAWSGGGAASGGQLAYLQVSAGAPSQTLTVDKDPAGSGQGAVMVDSLPGGLDCATGVPSCNADYLTDTALTLKAMAAYGSGFKGWSGECLGYDDCVVTMDQAKSVTAKFNDFESKGRVKVLSLNEGGKFLAGTVLPVYVGAPTAAEEFKYLYSIDNGATWTRITRKIPENSYNWQIPYLPKKSKNTLVKVEAYDNTKALVGSDVVNAPFLVKVVELQEPLPGATLASNGSVVISWTSRTSATVDSVSIQLRKRAGLPWAEIDSVPGDPGTYTWNQIPAVGKQKIDTRIRVVLKKANGKTIDSAASGLLKYDPPPPPPI